MTSSDSQLAELHVPAGARGGTVTIGNFDGVHRGHQAMLSVVSRLATDESRKAVVVTFDPHPVTILKPDIKLPRLTSIQHRARLLKQYGADEVVVLPVNKHLLSMSPRQFFDAVIVDRLQAAHIVEGPDFRFGRDRSGNTDVLQALCDQAGIQLTIMPTVCRRSETISSTAIRKRLSNGDFGEARELLGHAYTMQGIVTAGAGRGRELGFPTANLTGISELIPSDGVYAGSAMVSEKRYAVAANIGPNPTFDEPTRKIECHLIGYSGELYDQQLSVDLCSKLRTLKAFRSPEELVTQIAVDVQQCARLLDGTLGTSQRALGFAHVVVARPSMIDQHYA